ncbi:MAG: clostripain-related cysteine peptidase, partial [Anaerolineales bacterium]|nr:clostripain-related cysteine peptidase [Anaerolineales bacterium]
MKTGSNRFLNIVLAFTLLLSMQIACNAVTGGPVEEPTTESTTESTEPPIAKPATLGEPGTWLVMMYEDADDEILEEDMVFDMNEAELVGSTDQVTIVAQMDRFVGGYDGDGDVTSTKRYLLTQDDDLYTINSEAVEDLGEVDMGDGQTLYDFANWAIRTYPAEHYVLIMSDHGAGWTGGWSDDDPESGSGLTMQEIDDALGAIVADTGIGAFELVGFDACLMGQLEVMSAIAPHAKYAVGSEETEPSLGWAYAKFLQALNDNTAMTGRELGQAIVDSYIGQDIRITDDQARNIFAGGDFSADSVAADLSKDITLTTVDLSTFQNLNAAVNELAVALTGVDQELVAQARAYSQSYASVFGDDDPPSYIDLGHFVDLLLDSIDDPNVVQAAQQVKSALAQTVTAEMHGEEKPGSSGLTIYFPNSAEYVGTFGEWTINYPSSVGRFATASLWDDFLTFHYAGETFDPAAADLAVLTPAQSTQTDFTQAVEESAPDAGAQITAPGAGQ